MEIKLTSQSVQLHWGRDTERKGMIKGIGRREFMKSLIIAVPFLKKYFDRSEMEGYIDDDLPVVSIHVDVIPMTPGFIMPSRARGQLIKGDGVEWKDTVFRQFLPVVKR